MMFRKMALLTGTALSMTLSACGAQLATEHEVDARQADADARLEASLTRFGGREAIRAGGAQLSEGVFVAAEPERTNPGVMLPARFERADAIVLESSEKLSLNEIAARLGEITHIPHLVALGPTGDVSSPSLGRSEFPVTAADAVDMLAEGGSAAPVASNGLEIEPHLRGPLSDVLNAIAAAFEVEWSFVGGRVVFQDYVTRQYQISALPTTSTNSATIGGDAMTYGVSVSSDIWAEIQGSLSSLAGPGSSVNIGANTGMITVTARVSDQNRIARYVEELNSNIGQQITFDVNVLTVDLNRSGSLGVDLEAAFGGADVAQPAVPVGYSDGVLNIGIVEGSFSMNALVGALSSQGEVTVENRVATTTSNNRVAPVDITQTTTYLAEVASETDDDGNVSLTRTPGEVITGLQMQLLPRVLNNREVMVQYTLRLSELNELVTFGDGNDAIQLPEVSTTSFDQQAVLANGQTLVLAGFERDRIEGSDDSLAHVGEMPVMGSEDHKVERVATVLLITPRIINRASAIGTGN